MKVCNFNILIFCLLCITVWLVVFSLPGVVLTVRDHDLDNILLEHVLTSHTMREVTNLSVILEYLK